MTRTKIEWCDFTWNPVIGCTRGCPYCYAGRMARRFHMTADFSVPRWNERNFVRPFPQKPSRIFVNSMSDVADWRFEWWERVAGRIRAASQHTFFLLTKRPKRFLRGIPHNALSGISVTDQALYDRLKERRGDFLSIEPILGPITLDVSGAWPLRWVIVGAETGSRKGKVIPQQEWLREIFGFCAAHRIPLFFKNSLRTYWPYGAAFPQEFPV